MLIAVLPQTLNSSWAQLPFVLRTQGERCAETFLGNLDSVSHGSQCFRLQVALCQAEHWIPHDGSA